MKLRKWLRSFRFAYEGILYALGTQKNMKFHFAAAFLVFILALYFELPKTELLFVLLAVTLILVTELINTAIEKTVDLAMLEQHPVAKIAKDVAAAAVLVASIFACIIGFIVFYDPIEQWFQHIGHFERDKPLAAAWIIIILVLLIVTVLHTRFSQKEWFWRPSLLSALAFSISTMMMITSGDAFISLLAYILSIMTCIILFDKTSRTLTSLVLGAAIGCLISYALYFL